MIKSRPPGVFLNPAGKIWGGTLQFFGSLKDKEKLLLEDKDQDFAPGHFVERGND